MKNFWKELDRPFFVLAPMFDVTDAAFRALFAKHSKPPLYPLVLFTEFVSADGLCSIGREKLLPKLHYSNVERPIVAQLFSAHPEKIEKAAALCQDLGFDGVDINMGCPDRGIMRQGGCAALIDNPNLACEIIHAAKRGAPQIPISVKTRTGMKKDKILSWVAQLLSAGLDAITLHARTVSDLSAVPARWAEIGKLSELVRAEFPDTAVIGNGDVSTLGHGLSLAREYNVDGVMVGRGAFGAPWFFSCLQHERSIHEKLRILTEHILLFQKLCPEKNFAVIKKHFKAYISGFDGAGQLRLQMMQTQTPSSAIQILENYLSPE